MQRVQPLPKDRIDDPEMASVVEWAEEVVGDSGFSRLLARWPQLGKRFYRLYGLMYEESSVEPYILELMRIKSADTNECHF